MKRTWVWIIGGTWDRVAALTRLFLAVGVVLAGVTYYQQQDALGVVREQNAALRARVAVTTERVDQLTAALNRAGVPVPTVPTTTTTTAPSHRTRATTRPRATTTHPSPPTTTPGPYTPPTTTTAPCTPATAPPTPTTAVHVCPTTP